MFFFNVKFNFILCHFKDLNLRYIIMVQNKQKSVESLQDVTKRQNK